MPSLTTKGCRARYDEAQLIAVDLLKNWRNGNKGEAYEVLSEFPTTEALAIVGYMMVAGSNQEAHSISSYLMELI